MFVDKPHTQLCITNGLTLNIIENQQLSDNCSVDLSANIVAVQRQYKQYFHNGNLNSLRFCYESLTNLFYQPEVLSQLAQNWSFLELLNHMLDGQNDQLVMAISELICHLSMDLQLDCGLLRASGIFERLVDIGWAAKKLNNEPVLVAVLKALEYWTLVSVDNRKQILNIDGALELVTSSLSYKGDRKWTIGRWMVLFIYGFFQGTGILAFLFRLLCPSILYKCWDSLFRSYNVCVPFGSPENCSIIAEYLQTVLILAIEHGFMEYNESPFILDDKALFNLAIKYEPVRFNPTIFLNDPSIKFLLIPRTMRKFTWRKGHREECLIERLNLLLFYREYEIFSPYLPSRKSIAVVQHASRLLMSLSTDRFHDHESSMTHFREANVASILDSSHHMSNMPCPEMVLIFENECRTLVNVLDKIPEVRNRSEEWRFLLGLQKKYKSICIPVSLNEKDDNEKVYKKLTLMRNSVQKKRGIFLVGTIIGFLGIMVATGVLLMFFQLSLVLFSIPFPGKTPHRVQSWIDTTGSGDDFVQSINLFTQRILFKLVSQYPVLVAGLLQLPVFYGICKYIEYTATNYRMRVFWSAAEHFGHISSIRWRVARGEFLHWMTFIAFVYFAILSYWLLR